MQTLGLSDSFVAINKRTRCCGMAVNRDETILVLAECHALCAIAVFSLPDGVLARLVGNMNGQPGCLEYPQTVCFAPSSQDRVLVADPGQQRIQVRVLLSYDHPSSLF